MQLSWKTEQRKVKDLVPYEFNPRFMTEDRKQKLIASLERFNLVEIPVVDTNNVLLAGHQRIKIMLELNRHEDIIDVRVPNRELTDLEFKEYNITSNLQAGFWDTDLLDEAFADIDLKSLGLDVANIEIPEVPFKKPEKEEDFTIVTPRNPISEENDVIELHSLDKRLVHRIICSSSTESNNYDKLFSDNEKINLTLTDPPYNVNYTGGTNESLKIKNDNMSNSEFYNFLFDFYSNTFKHSLPGAGIYVFHADSEGANFRQALINSKFKLAQCLVWVKNQLVMGRQDYHWMHEPILYGWKEGAAHSWYSDRSQTTVINWDKPLRNEEHPTMKPVGLVQYFIDNSSKRYDIVFDGFLGSGTTLISCEISKRHCRAFELDPIYFDVDIRRWHTYMKDNGLDYKIIRNERELTEEEIQEYYQRIG